MNNLVIMKERQAVTTSLQVADGFEKRHSDVIRAIEDKLSSTQNCVQYQSMFANGSYKDASGKQNKMYYMNRDGFTFIAMGFTGNKADNFKLLYIDAFNEMENHIKQEMNMENLSPELQMFGLMHKALANQELATKRLESKVDGISDLITLETKDWRKEVNGIIRKIAVKQGGFDRFSEVGSESYRTLEEKARCSLNIRLENRQKNMIAQGVGKAAVKRLNKLDIIEEDHRLKEIYISVVKSMAIKYGVYEKEISK